MLLPIRCKSRFVEDVVDFAFVDVVDVASACELALAIGMVSGYCLYACGCILILYVYSTDQ